MESEASANNQTRRRPPRRTMFPPSPSTECGSGEASQGLVVSLGVHLGAMRRAPVSNRLKSEYVACAVTCSSGDEYVSCI